MRVLWQGVVAIVIVSVAADADEPRKVDVPSGYYIRGVGGSLKSEQVKITTRAFRIDQDEVTVGQYDACVKAGKCKKVKGAPKEVDHPVANVTWDEAGAYCKFAGGRLPTAAEWERVAFPPLPDQHGTGPLYYKEDLCTQLNIGGFDDKKCKNATGTWTVTAIRVVDEPGLIVIDRSMVGDVPVYDLFGNVSEWVSDWDSLPGNPEYYFKPKTTTDPPGPPSGSNHVIVGGSYGMSDGQRADSLRFGDVKDRFKDVGFRCAYSSK
jgi:formylglycine-generating enzyme required for sulfatase activity